MYHKIIIILFIFFGFLNFCFAQCIFENKDTKIYVQETSSSSNLLSKKEILSLEFFKHIKIVCRNEYTNLTSNLKDSIQCTLIVEKINIVAKNVTYACELLTISNIDSNLFSTLKELESKFLYDCLSGEYKTMYGYIFIPAISKGEIRIVRVENKSQKKIYKF